MVRPCLPGSSRARRKEAAEGMRVLLEIVCPNCGDVFHVELDQYVEGKHVCGCCDLGFTKPAVSSIKCTVETMLGEAQRGLRARKVKGRRRT